MSFLTTDNLKQSTPLANGDILVKDGDSVRPAVSADITALGGTSGGDVLLLQGVAWGYVAHNSSPSNSSQYRANFRGQSTGDFGLSGHIWYDKASQTMITQGGAVVNKRKIADNSIIASVNTITGGGILQGHKNYNWVFTRKGGHKIDLNTMSIVGNVGGTVYDISPDGTVGIALTNHVFGAPGATATVKFFDTATLATLGSYTFILGNASPTDTGKFYDVTLISNTECVINLLEWLPGSASSMLRKVNSSGTVLGNYVWLPGISNDSFVEYSPHTNLLYLTDQYSVFSVNTSFAAFTSVMGSSAGGNDDIMKDSNGNVRYGRAVLSSTVTITSHIIAKDPLFPYSRSSITALTGGASGGGFLGTGASGASIY